MFKIESPKILDLEPKDIKECSDNFLENYYFTKQNINLCSEMNISSCKFENVVFNEAVYNNLSFDDVIFVNCDLSSIKFVNSSFYRVQFSTSVIFY